MTKFIKWLFISSCVLLSPFFAGEALANTINASSCSVSDVQAAINSAKDGDTVVIPNGSCSWSTGITTTKQIALQGASTGCIAPSSCGLTITDTDTNAADSLLTLSTGNSFHTTIANISFLPGTGTGIYLTVNGTGLPALMHDVSFNLPNFQLSHAVQWFAAGGVIWNANFYSTNNLSGSCGQQIGSDSGSIIVRPPSPAWDSPSTTGMLDSSGTINLYIEDSIFNMVGQSPDVDTNGRVAIRHTQFMGSAGLNHGATSSTGGRQIELYDNVFSYANPNRDMNRWFWFRGGTGVITGNRIDWINGGCYPNKPSWGFTAENAQRPADKGCCVGFMCWHQPGSGSDGVNHSPANTPPTVDPTTGSPVALGRDAMQVSEPIYIWGNSGTGDGISHIDFTEGQPNTCNTGKVPLNPATGQQWKSADLVVINRDLFVDNGAKPGWARYPYPHPLRGSSGPAPDPPTNPTAVVH